MGDRLTDRAAIRIALSIAIDSEEALIDGYSHFPAPEKEASVVQSRKLIAAFQRVLDRYYGGKRAGAIIDNGERVSIYDILKGLHPNE